jgi:A/G-specific adenine glycosylase
MSPKKTTDRYLQNRQNVGSEQSFARKLLQWNRLHNKRQMPWKGEKDPYKIWLSEVILQQTRVEQGKKYYENFINAFPDVHALASASEEKVLKYWEGLGYYSRCRNLIHSAKYISEKRNGLFPQDYESILQLKGVGNYTAAAIASFAYNLPFAVLDGNVFRILSRIMAIDTPIDSTAGKKQFSALAQELLPKTKAGEYNQAIMDFGATICKPVPECHICFFNKNCKAYLAGQQDLLPVKEKKLKIRERWFNYIVIRFENEVLLHQRKTKDIWQHLFEFLLIESEHSIERKKILQLVEKQYAISNYRFCHSFVSQQRLTHQQINFCFIEIEMEQKEMIPGFFWTKIPDLNTHAFPKTLQQFASTYLK